MLCTFYMFGRTKRKAKTRRPRGGLRAQNECLAGGVVTILGTVSVKVGLLTSQMAYFQNCVFTTFWKAAQAKVIKDPITSKFIDRIKTDYCLKTFVRWISHYMGPRNKHYTFFKKSLSEPAISGQLQFPRPINYTLKKRQDTVQFIPSLKSVCVLFQSGHHQNQPSFPNFTAWTCFQNALQTAAAAAAASMRAAQRWETQFFILYVSD